MATTDHGAESAGIWLSDTSYTTFDNTINHLSISEYAAEYVALTQSDEAGCEEFLGTTVADSVAQECEEYVSVPEPTPSSKRSRLDFIEV